MWVTQCKGEGEGDGRGIHKILLIIRQRSIFTVRKGQSFKAEEMVEVKFE